MTKNQTPYGHGNDRYRSKRQLAANYFSNRAAAAASKPSEGITVSTVGNSVTLRQRKIYSRHRPAIENALGEHGAISASARTEGNYFHLAATFPDVNSAELALEAIRSITNPRRG